MTQLAPSLGSNAIVVHGLDWRRYRDIAHAIGESHVRLTYSAGELEFMTLSHGHERCCSLIGRMIDVLTEELDLPVQSGGSTTLDREDLDRGAEPDRCYYLEHEPLVRGKEEIDLAVDPPPDLAVEVDMSRSSRVRLTIYAMMGIPEVWRFDGETMWFHRLNAEPRYDLTSESLFFPGISPNLLSEFLAQRSELDDTRLMRRFRQWVRDNLLN